MIIMLVRAADISPFRRSFSAVIGRANMRANNSKEIIDAILSNADVRTDGSRPWDIRVYNDAMYDRILKQGLLGLGESFMDGWWDADELDVFSYKANRARLDRIRLGSRRIFFALLAKAALNSRRLAKAFEIGERHYDIGNSLYEKMLDKSMAYSCGYWKDTDCLNEAQEKKHDLICRKLGIEKGMKVLDIGCGWGGFARYAAERYGAAVDGITVSKEQARFAAESCRHLPVRILLKDYRQTEGLYDRVVSIGMFEHVGYSSYRTFMRKVNSLLHDNGIFLLHTIGRNTSARSNDPWIDKYIFPNSMLPSIKQIGSAVEGLFVMEDWHNFSADYDRTLMAWYENFDSSWKDLEHKYNERFYRMWKYYLLICAGAFRARRIQLWQVIFSKHGIAGGYASIR